MRSE
jgi:transposase InsO family protein